MMKYSIIIIAILNLYNYCYANNEGRTCDSLLADRIKMEMELILRDSITKTVVDSSDYRIIAGIKAYSEKVISNSISVDSLCNIIEANDKECALKNYAYAFDFLLEKSLAFNYDYYNQFVLSPTGDYYINRFRTKDYQINKRKLDTFFRIYHRYKTFLSMNYTDINSTNNFYGKPDSINEIIKFGLFKFPSITKKIMLLSPPMDQDKYFIKLREVFK